MSMLPPEHRFNFMLSFYFYAFCGTTEWSARSEGVRSTYSEYSGVPGVLRTPYYSGVIQEYRSSP